MKVAVIGSNSLLASYIIDHLLAIGNCQLVLFGKTEPIEGNELVTFNYFNYPAQSLDFAALLSFDAIIYCAAAGVQSSAMTDTLLIYQINAFLPIQIINYLNDNSFSGVWISFGSYFEIGNNNDVRLFSEVEVASSTLSVPNHYCLSKRLLTRFVSGDLHKINAYHLILPTIYGARENSIRIIPYIVGALREGRKLQLSAGIQVRQYLHCQDVVTLVALLLRGGYTTGIYNIANEKPIRIADLVQHIFSTFNQDSQLYLGTLNTRDESMKYLALSTEKIAKQILDWNPVFNIQKGIKEYL
jgi:nucleoside-diphosphate-sugar epimerase